MATMAMKKLAITPIAMALHIIVFQVEKQESGTIVVPGPLSIKYLRRQVYEFKSVDEL